MQNYSTVTREQYATMTEREQDRVDFGEYLSCLPLPVLRAMCTNYHIEQHGVHATQMYVSMGGYLTVDQCEKALLAAFDAGKQW